MNGWSYYFNLYCPPIQRYHLPSLGLMKVYLPSNSLKKFIRILNNKIKTLFCAYSRSIQGIMLKAATENISKMEQEVDRTLRHEFLTCESVLIQSVNP